MSNTGSVMHQCKVVQRPREEALTTAFESEERRLRQLVAMYTIGCRLGLNTWSWDVQKPRVVNITYLAGQHATQDSEELQRCRSCAALKQVLLNLAAYGIPPEGNGCQHMIGASRAEHAQDDLAGAVHQVSLPVVFIHRTVPSKDDSCSFKCAVEFRSHLQRFGVRELVATEIGDRS